MNNDTTRQPETQDDLATNEDIRFFLFDLIADFNTAVAKMDPEDDTILGIILKGFKALPKIAAALETIADLSYRLLDPEEIELREYARLINSESTFESETSDSGDQVEKLIDRQNYLLAKLNTVTETLLSKQEFTTAKSRSNGKSKQMSPALQKIRQFSRKRGAV